MAIESALLRLIRTPDRAIKLRPSAGVPINEVPLYYLKMIDIDGMLAADSSNIVALLYLLCYLSNLANTYNKRSELVV